MTTLFPGSKFFTTTDGALGTAGKPTRVHTISLVSGGTASTVKLYDGTVASGNQYVQVDGTINKGTFLDSSAGIYFPNGCFVNVDANTVGLVVTYHQEQ